MLDFELMSSKMSNENPYGVIITGDFNCRSTQWWANDNKHDEGKSFEPLTSELGPHQLISEPTNTIGQSKSCIDLIFTDQPNLFIESGVHPSLHEQCHHEVVHGKLSVKSYAPPPYSRKLWYRADFLAIRKSIEVYNWQESFETVRHPDDQVKILNEVLLNVCSNFIPNRVKTIRPRQAAWITQNIKTFSGKNHAYKSFFKKENRQTCLKAFKI